MHATALIRACLLLTLGFLFSAGSAPAQQKPAAVIEIATQHLVHTPVTFEDFGLPSQIQVSTAIQGSSSLPHNRKQLNATVSGKRPLQSALLGTGLGATVVGSGVALANYATAGRDNRGELVGVSFVAGAAVGAVVGGLMGGIVGALR